MQQLNLSRLEYEDSVWTSLRKHGDKCYMLYAFGLDPKVVVTEEYYPSDRIRFPVSSEAEIIGKILHKNNTVFTLIELKDESEYDTARRILLAVLKNIK